MNILKSLLNHMAVVVLYKQIGICIIRSVGRIVIFFLFLCIVNRKQNVRQYVQFIFNNSLKVCGNDDLYGKNMKNQTLFENFKRYWKICHHENKRFFWLGKFMPRLESNICRKWIKSFPDIELFLKLVKDKYDYFNALDFNVYSENYFETLQR